MPVDKLSTEQVASALNSGAIHLLRSLAAVDKLAGLTPARLSALSVLVFAGPQSLGALAAVERVAGPTMTRIVDGLARSGLAERQPDPADGRAVLIAATAAGDSLMRAAAAAGSLPSARPSSVFRPPTSTASRRPPSCLTRLRRQSGSRNPASRHQEGRAGHGTGDAQARRAARLDAVLASGDITRSWALATADWIGNCPPGCVARPTASRASGFMTHCGWPGGGSSFASCSNP